jgi:hypothetical protein
MDPSYIKEKFEKIGARLKFGEMTNFAGRGLDLPMVVDVQKDKKGEFFLINLRRGWKPEEIDLKIPDANSDQRHLLMTLETGPVAKNSRINLILDKYGRQPEVIYKAIKDLNLNFNFEKCDKEIERSKERPGIFRRGNPIGIFLDRLEYEDIEKLIEKLNIRLRIDKIQYLCGHDERQWFVSGVPDGVKASNVLQAMESLKPPLVGAEQAKKGLRKKDLLHAGKRRKNEAYKRQGEWFFIPTGINPNPALIHKKEPIIARRGSKPHICEELYREGGTTVYVRGDVAPNGFNEKEYQNYVAKNPKDKLPFRTMTRDASVYVRGDVRHPDHKTVHLGTWHKVLLNREAESRAARGIAFLD